MASSLLRVLGQTKWIRAGMCVLAIGLTGLIARDSMGQQAEPSVDSTFGTTAEGAFPKEWYVRDGEGLESLRSLEGKPAQELSIAEWKGDAKTLAQLKGKIVVLDFWATWCGPCMAAIPKNVAFVEKYKDKGVALIGIHDAKGGWDTVDQVIGEKGINYPVALDATKDDQGETTKAYALKFWPTYFIIDRDGIVRGAGIKPNKIEDAILQLMDSNTGSTNMVAANTSAAFPDRWFLGGDKRLKSFQNIEGKPSPKLSLADWVGTSLEKDNWDQRVRVIQFVRPEVTASVDQLTKVQAVSERFTKQGVVFLAVCDSRATVDRMKAVAEEKRIDIPIAMDRPSENAAQGIGATGNSMGIKFVPNTIVIDRTGVLRAAGLKPEFLDRVLNQLLAEVIPIQESASEPEIFDDEAKRPKPAQEISESAKPAPKPS